MEHASRKLDLPQVHVLRDPGRVLGFVLENLLYGPVLADVLERTRRANVLDTLREVGPEQERKVDELVAVQLENFADFRAGDEEEGTLTTSEVTDQGCIVNKNILQRTRCQRDL